MGARSTKNTTQNNRSDGHLLEYFRNTFVRGGGSRRFSTTGGTIADSGGYRYHAFTSSGSFIVEETSITNIEYTIIAGGGSGGNQTIPGGYSGGGGGAGGFRTGSLPVSVQSYPIIVGAGAAAGPGETKNSGNPSIGFGITSIGGGAGGAGANTSPGLSGGSGGGGGVYAGGPGSGTPGQGFNGGDSSFVPSGFGGSAAGGGGAGGVGANGIIDGSTTRTSGGAGITTSWLFLSGTLCAGGSGGAEDGNVGDSDLNATNYGGGGGGNSGTTPGSGGSGYPGIIVIRYPF